MFLISIRIMVLSPFLIGNQPLGIAHKFINLFHIDMFIVQTFFFHKLDLQNRCNSILNHLLIFWVRPDTSRNSHGVLKSKQDWLVSEGHVTAIFNHWYFNIIISCFLYHFEVFIAEKLSVEYFLVVNSVVVTTDREE